MTVDTSSETATGNQSSDEGPKTDTVGGLRDHPLLIGGMVVGYFVAVIVTVVVPFLLVRFPSFFYGWRQQAVDVFAEHGVPGAEWVFGPFVHLSVIGSVPVIVVLSVACLDLLVLRSLMGESQLNHRGLFVWIGGSVLGVIVIPSVLFLHPLGLMLFIPGIIGIVVGSGIVNIFVPHALFEGVSLRTAGRQSTAAVVDSPTVVVRPVSVLLASWVVGTICFIAGVVVLLVTIAAWIVGLFFPIPLLLWLCSALVFAVGHVQYRLWTLTAYGRHTPVDSTQSSGSM